MLRQVIEGSHLVDGLTFANFYKQHLQAKPQQTGGIGRMCYNALFLMILTKALSHSLRATIMMQLGIGHHALGIPMAHGVIGNGACDCFLYLFMRHGHEASPNCRKDTSHLWLTSSSLID